MVHSTRGKISYKHRMNKTNNYGPIRIFINKSNINCQLLPQAIYGV